MDTEQQDNATGYMSVVLDTLNAIQNDAYIKHLKEEGQASFNKWRDFGVEIYDLYNFMKNWNCDIVQVLGFEGSGKTVGAMFLKPEETLYLNSDNKPLTFDPIGYSDKNLRVVRTYDEVKELIRKVVDTKLNPKAKGRLTVFVLAHTDVYKVNAVEREKLRVLGNFATKMNIEGSVVHTYYTKVDTDMSKEDSQRFKLLTKNTGYNTGRSPLGMWDTLEIPNNYQMILDKIIARRK